MSIFDQCLTPRLKPLQTRRSTTLSVLDIGTSKIVCLVAEMKPVPVQEVLQGRTHIPKIIGIGQHRSQGIKAGAIVDLDAAERSIRQAVHMAERMAGVEIRSVIVNLTGGRLGSRHFHADQHIYNGTVSSSDLDNVLEKAASGTIESSRVVLHSLHTGFSLDFQKGLVDPIGMVGNRLGVNLNVVTSEAAATRNLMLAVERCHLGVEAVVATPYASGLAALADDEAEMGVCVIDMGGGTTKASVFMNRHLVHADALAIGGHHVTMDIARGLTTRMNDAERLKIQHGSALSLASYDRDLISVPQVDEDEQDAPQHISKSRLTRITQARVCEILELMRERLKQAGFAAQAGRRVVLTGGACQLHGIPEVTKKILCGQVRIGRPLGVKNLPDAARGPAFSTSVGLLVYPQVAGQEYTRSVTNRFIASTGTNGYFGRVGRWFKESF